MQPDNEIWYTSTDGKVVELYFAENDPSNAAVVSNTYDDKGVIVFDQALKRLGQQAFASTKLSSIQLPGSLTFISVSAFNNTNLREVVIPEGVTGISNGAFSNNDNLTKISLPESLTFLGDNPFDSCPSLTSFEGKWASEDGRCIIQNGSRLLAFAPYGLTSYTIPEGVTFIGSEVFYGYQNLVEINLPSSLQTIRVSAFENCGFDAITLPEGLKEIQGYVFYDCENLKEITLPKSLEKIYYRAFAYCSSLEKIVSLAVTPPTEANAIFENTGVCPIYVPEESVEAYKTAEGWSDYADRIQAIPAE